MKLPVVSSRKVIKALSSAGFKISRQSGSHVIMTKQEREKITVVIPKHVAIARGTLVSIISQSGLSREEFCKLLE